jgi:hypothetical protein
MNRQQRRAAAKAVPQGDDGIAIRLQSQAQSALAQGNHREAAQALKRWVKLRPGDGRAWRLLGQALVEIGQTSDSLGAFRQALALDDDDGEARNSLAGALKELGLCEESLAMMRQAVTRNPKDDRAMFNLSLLLLTLGQYEEGWDAYEARLRIPGLDIHTGFPQPQWDGGDIADKCLLVHAEQGLGDVIQFARYLPMLTGLAKRVLFAVPANLTTLFQGLPGVDALLTGEGPAPLFDCHCPLLSLPRLLKTRPETIPAVVPYLKADEQRLHLMAERFPTLLESVPKIGLVWAGEARFNNRLAHRMDRQRSLRLADFAALAKVAEVTFVSLQKGAAAAQIKTAPAGLRLLDPMPSVSDFADTAAVIAHLDLVITVDTAVAHLAGALGKPVWILSRYDGCWRWFKDRDDSPWYPTARLFRQSAPGDWSGVMKRLADALVAWTVQKGGNW